MTRDIITEVRVGGMRCIDTLRLPLSDLTVIIGENGTGKSTLIEALTLLQLAADRNLLGEIFDRHQGLRGLLRQGTRRLSLGVSVDGPDGAMTYDIVLGYDGHQARVLEEWLLMDSGESVVDRGDYPLTQLRLPRFANNPSEPTGRMLNALTAIDVHLPFQVTAQWATDDHTRSTRDSVQLRDADSLALYGTNLACAYYTLKQEFGSAHWEETLSLVRLGLGYHIESVDARTRDAGGPGLVTLAIRDRRFREPIPASSLSDGMLAYLSFVALCRLNTHKSIVAFDEPELHLHPGLLARVVQLFEHLSQSTKVLLVTHSNQLLDCLSDPVAATIRCELNEEGASRWLRMDSDEFAQWKEEYSGLGQMREAGLERVLLSHEIKS